MLRQYELVDLVKSYDPDADEDALNKAYVFAMKKHGAQLRASGDPYYSHPVEVAGILTKFKLDSASIIAGLLHDTVEDTDTTVEEIRDNFGAQVAQLVDGLTKLAMIEQKSANNKQAENFRKLLLAMSEDVRVLLIKLADRLHNMRTLHFLKKPEKRARIAKETLDIYAPLAERIGMQEVKTELEEIAFAELHKEAHDSIVARLNFLREQGNNLVPKIISRLEKDMKDNGIDADITGREKSPYSIWRKMQQKNASFEQLSDIMAFRICVDDIGACYQALGVVHSKYHMVPRRFKDYISTPKPNGYQSIHTGVIGPENTRIEIQIRTREMHEIAEKGIAAHWAYKQGQKAVGKNFRWIRELLEILEQASNPEEFLENTKLEMYNDQVFCFTPKGDLIGLPMNSTPVDFAYAVHSTVGDTCVGAKINGEIRPLRTILQNGDQVEVLTSKAQHPSTEWERFVVTGKAKAAIRRYVRAFKRDQFITLGQQLLERTFKGENLEFSEKGLVNILPNFEAESIDDIYAKVGEGLVTAWDVMKAVYPGYKQSKLGRVVKSLKVPVFKKSAKEKKSEPLKIKGLIPGMAVHFAGCCHPLPGDRIVGIVTTGKGVAIHTIDCKLLEKYADEPERWLDISWGDAATDAPHVGRLKVMLNNEPGALAELSNLVARNNGNIANLNIVYRTISYFEILVDIEVKDLKHLTDIIAAMKASKVISYVSRSVQ
ncbi:MAG: bifunctional (p)ppGpp synthetase/guanosine-3',5'-bis(diphosphate) 3'-pyrophosphohydrolase [Alphaproteobacteria bacterium]|nr:bifunctional (p)ppGpp synthetase/guanosine-3',5'-bis(diphosphate) 3'-pyrophosphohydrolase [Alphaproteobacteria bacterium]MBQ8631933.1 bifunctional (p)ppGpp synthetase/guanosine-3',5'-bis(diphosphate) 3'-pyrophosphohydrolase [Alphaproteobacteria bacterium]